MNCTPKKCPLFKVNNNINNNNNETKWWPNRLDLSCLRLHSNTTNPMDADFNYGVAFKNLNYFELKKDIKTILHESTDWWPADWGHYGPLFIRLAWHSAGTYRLKDGKGGSRQGMQRYPPINSWPDNTNLDKARRLLWSVKQKYGRNISWADLMILAGNVALEDMGFKTIGFAGGREDVWQPNTNVYWGSEQNWLDNSKRYKKDGTLENSLAAVQMGLIYVNPEGPNGIPDPVLAAHDIRTTFNRMGMNDEETVALIAGGHTFGKTHGAASVSEYLGCEPEAASIEEQGFGWINNYKSGKGKDQITSGLEVIWTTNPTKWNGNEFFKILFGYEWQLTKSPGGANQWIAKNSKKIIPDPFNSTKFHCPTMLTTDLSLRFDPKYEKISRRFLKHPKAFNTAFANAWFKLTHRDMGPRTTYIGPEIPNKVFIWQDPIPKANYPLINEVDLLFLEQEIEQSQLTISEMVGVAWCSASTYRHSDRRGGANGSRIRLKPMNSWKVNNPNQLEKVLKVYKIIQTKFNQNNKKKVSIADLIVIGGNLGIKKAALAAGYNNKDIDISFTPGRTDATQDQTDIASFQILEPILGDGFRNYQNTNKSNISSATCEQILIDKAQQLCLTVSEMTVLIGGMRVLNTNYDGSNKGVLTNRPGVLTNDFFVNLLDMKYKWRREKDEFIGCNRQTGEKIWNATRIDLIFGFNSELRAIAEIYACNDGQDKFVNDFINAWTKVMMLDRFDV